MNRERIIQLLKDKIQEYTDKAVNSDDKLLYTFALVQSELNAILKEIESYEE
jgi:hypothetical protein